jgi:sugar O-acyltransferase (sialic acid O-acetyltransferase NeuD family)
MSTETIYAIFGAGGYGREVMPLAREQLKREGKDTQNLYFVVDQPDALEVNGVKVLSFEIFLQMKAEKKYLVCAIASSLAREEIKRRIEPFGITWWSLYAANCVIMDDVILGQGAILSPFVTLTSNIKIGENFHANIYSYVAHDCIVGDFVTLAPGVKCNGNVIIGDHAYIGTGAIIRPGEKGSPLIIGAKSIIGMGSVVTKDVPAGATVFGNPARVLKG